jgi:hypothetical protein
MIAVYWYAVLISLYGFFVFLWWWRRVGTASSTYIFVALIFGTNAFSDVVAGYLRHIKDTEGIQSSLDFQNTCLWVLRRIPELIVLTIFCYSVTKKIIVARREEKEGKLIIGNHKKGEK